MLIVVQVSCNYVICFSQITIKIILILYNFIELNLNYVNFLTYILITDKLY